MGDFPSGNVDRLSGYAARGVATEVRDEGGESVDSTNDSPSVSSTFSRLTSSGDRSVAAAWFSITASIRGPRTEPGHTALAVTPWGPPSAASVRASPSMPAFELVHEARSGTRSLPRDRRDVDNAAVLPPVSCTLHTPAAVYTIATFPLRKRTADPDVRLEHRRHGDSRDTADGGRGSTVEPRCGRPRRVSTRTPEDDRVRRGCQGD